jgi:ubiquinone/menaquinone biosynthesis C-methylase UbiE
MISIKTIFRGIMPENAETAKSAKELAYLHDFYVATDWSERFAELIDEKLKLPDEGQFLYVEGGTGNHALALREKLAETVDFYFSESDAERLRIARTKAQTVDAPVHFQNSFPHQLNFPNAAFGNVVADASFLRTENLFPVWSEIYRVLETGGTAFFALPTAGSFGQFFSVFWEALYELEMLEFGAEVERLITALPTVSDVETVARNAGFENIESSTALEIFEYETGGDFLRSPLISDFLLPLWTKFVPASERVKLLGAIEEVIDSSRSEMTFRLSVKMTLITARKSINTRPE